LSLSEVERRRFDTIGDMKTERCSLRIEDA
jgi:hypothetical protein